jgi:hypothetical protein
MVITRQPSGGSWIGTTASLRQATSGMAWRSQATSWCGSTVPSWSRTCSAQCW